MKLVQYIILSIGMLIQSGALAQNYSRFQADFSIKTKGEKGGHLAMGTVYFDKNNQKIVYFHSFPQKTINLAVDTLNYNISEDGKVVKLKSLVPVRYSFFSMALNSQLTNFGLEAAGFTLTKSTKENNMVISTYEPIAKSKNKGPKKILVSTIDKKLNGLVFLDGMGQVITKQFYSDYINVQGLTIPTEITTIIYGPDKKESYQVTTYRNIKINELKETDKYNYSLPSYQ